MTHLKELRKRHNINQNELANIVGVSRSTIAMWETEKSQPDNESLLKIAEYFNVSTDYLLGRDDEYITFGLRAPNVTDKYTTFHVIGEVAASFDHYAYEDWSEDTVDIPDTYLKGRKKEDFFVLRITGDSMYPLYHDGDKVLVLKQSVPNHSGEVAVVIYDDDIGTIKKLEYPQNREYMRLVPINPNVAPTTIEGERLAHFRVIGIPKLLIREIQ